MKTCRFFLRFNLSDTVRLEKHLTCKQNVCPLYLTLMVHNVDMHSSSIDYALQLTADQTNHRGGSQPPILRHKVRLSFIGMNVSVTLLPELNYKLLNDYILHKRPKYIITRYILCLILLYSGRSTDTCVKKKDSYKSKKHWFNFFTQLKVIKYRLWSQLKV